LQFCNVMLGFLFLVSLCDAAIISQDCLEIESPVCVGDLIIPKTTASLAEEGLIKEWTFDEEEPKKLITHHGPGLMGFGSSAYFDAAKEDPHSDYIVVDHQPISNTRDWSVLLWIFLFPYKTDSFVAVLQKGDQSLPLLSILLWPSIPRLRIKLRKTAIDTISSLPIGRWTQLTIVKEGGIGSVYVNGLLDSQTILGTGHSMGVDSGEYYLSSTPWHHGIHGYLDQIRFYEHPLTEDQVRAVASFAFPSGDGVSLPYLGCYRCSLQRALSVCGAKVGSHLCSRMELRSSVLLMARSLGWISLHHVNHPGEPDLEIEVWNHEEGIQLLSTFSNDNNNINQTQLAKTLELEKSWLWNLLST